MLIRDAMCGAGYGERTESGPTAATATGTGIRHSRRRHGRGDTQAALRQLLPGLVIAAPQASEPALTSVVATCYLLGVSTRRMERLVESLGVTSLSKSQVSIMAKELDEAVGAFRPARSTPDRTHSSPPTRWCSRSVKSAEPSGCTP